MNAPSNRESTDPQLASVLIADDQADVRGALKLLIEGEGYTVVTAASPEEAYLETRRLRPDIVFLDLNYRADTTSGVEGLELLSRLRSLDPDRPLVVLTGWGTAPLAVEAMKRGAQDFLEKPWDNARVLTVLKSQLALARARQKYQRLAAENRSLVEPSSGLLTRSEIMKEILRGAERVAASNAAVLITGESGTGKGLLARWVHEHSPRAGGPFIRVNLGGLVESLIESELFGHVRGAFTDARSERIGRFELAHQGTLFLDEIANLSLASQASLLHVLEEGQIERVGSSKPVAIDVRIVAATNADIRANIKDGRFRADLFYRLNTIEMHLPPLRERCEDIVLLANHYFAETVHRHGKSLSGFSPSALQALGQYDWPGNVRELAHVIERAVLLAGGDCIELPDLRLTSGMAAKSQEIDTLTLEQAERYLVRRALELSQGDADRAARQLGVSRSAFYRRLAKYRQ
ncbi:MAG: sigma-54-dependent transcriptional regulator [Gammaproteobacteria bacterium]